MTAPRKGPNAGSRAYLALMELHKAGGQVEAADFMKAADWAASPGHFDRMVVKPLERFRLVFRRGTLLVLSDGGLAFLGAAGAVPMPEQVVTPGAGTYEMRPLAARNMPRMAVMRPGALDYRDIPSRCSNISVAYKSNIKVEIGQG
jgi:hypothetical protein